MSAYSDQFKDPRWQRRRLEILSRDEFSCQWCQSKDSTLHVHHKRYVKGRKVWEYSDDELVTFCDECHKEWHRMDESRALLFAQAPIEGPGAAHQLIALCAGFLAAEGYLIDPELKELGASALVAGAIAQRIHEAARYREDRLLQVLGLFKDRDNAGQTLDAIINLAAKKSA